MFYKISMKDKKLKTLIEIDRQVWSQTKAFATCGGHNLAKALEILLTEILEIKGFTIPSLSNSELEGENTCL